jgi:hypothetical protein
LTGGATITWQANKALYACTGTGEISTVNLSYKSTDLFDPAAIASQISVQGAGTRSIFDPVDEVKGMSGAFATGDRYDVGAYNNLLFVFRAQATTSGVTELDAWFTDSPTLPLVSHQLFNVARPFYVTPSLDHYLVLTVPVLARYMEFATIGTALLNTDLWVYGTNTTPQPSNVDLAWLFPTSAFVGMDVAPLSFSAAITYVPNAVIAIDIPAIEGNVRVTVDNNTSSVINYNALLEWNIGAGTYSQRDVRRGTATAPVVAANSSASYEITLNGVPAQFQSRLSGAGAGRIYFNYLGPLRSDQINPFVPLN